MTIGAPCDNKEQKGTQKKKGENNMHMGSQEGGGKGIGKFFLWHMLLLYNLTRGHNGVKKKHNPVKVSH